MNKQEIAQLLRELAATLNLIADTLSPASTTPKDFDPSEFMKNLISVIQSLGQIAVAVIPLFTK